MAGQALTNRVQELRILLVEKERANQLLVASAMETTNRPISATFAEDGFDLLVTLRHMVDEDNSPTVIVVDPKIIGLDSQNVLEQIVAEEDLAKIPIVILSGSRRAEDLRRSYKLGALRFLTKPELFRGYVSLLKELPAVLAERQATGELDLAYSVFSYAERIRKDETVDLVGLDYIDLTIPVAALKG